MKTPFRRFALILTVPALLLSGCLTGRTATPDEAPAGIDAQVSPPGLWMGDEALQGEPKAPQPIEIQPALGAPAMAAPTMAPSDLLSPGAANRPAAAGQMIIKHADVRLLVADTSVAIDRATQIVGDVGGYIVSSRIWYQDYYGESLPYASFTLAVPVDEFEGAMRRLRDLAVRVLDETASGDDVTDQYVDLQSQVANLEVTRERIKSFLDQAKTVDEALRINQQLSEIEGQIEELKGRMNFLSDRSAYSTITVNFEPEFPKLTPTPTPTPTATPTPRPWKPGDTFGEARRTVTYAYQGLADFLIWVVVVLVPLFAPPILIAWGVWRLLRRKQK